MPGSDSDVCVCVFVCACVCVCVPSVCRVRTKRASVDNRTQSTTQWIAINSHKCTQTHTHTHTHTQIPESTRMRSSDIQMRPANQRASFTAAIMKPVNEQQKDDGGSVTQLLVPVSLIFTLFSFSPSSFFFLFFPRMDPSVVKRW